MLLKLAIEVWLEVSSPEMPLAELEGVVAEKPSGSVR
jgi:hypothetical protein